MIRISALNDLISYDHDTTSQPAAATKEAQEEEAFSLYNKALQLQNQNEFEKAEQMFLQLLKTPFLAQVVQNEENDGPLQPSTVLKYSTHKNLANIALRNDDYNKAMESYLEAVNLDSSDVSIWFKIGTTALNIHNYPLARLAFEEGLKCNPNHWPCLDNLITVLYALNDYTSCLYYISQALLRDSDYVKGLAIRDKIFQEQPSLRADSMEIFKNCSIQHSDYDKEEAEKYVEESLEMRRIKRNLGRPEPLPVLKFDTPLTSYTWKCLGKCLISLYKKINSSLPDMSFASRVDLGYYLNPDILSLTSNSENNEQPSDISSTDNQQGPLSLVTSTHSSAVSSPQPTTIFGPEGPTFTETIPINEATLETDEMLGQNFLDSSTPLTEGVLVGTKRGPKRKRLSMEFSDSFVTKRRSARVRNTNVVKKQDNVNYFDLLQKFLPSSLLAEKADHAKDALPAKQTLSVTETIISPNEGGVENIETPVSNTLTDNEEDCVKKFLELFQKNSGLLDVLNEYLLALTEINKQEWPLGLTDIYVTAYDKLRKHITRPSLFCRELSNEFIKKDALMTLIFCELKMDSWSVYRAKNASLLASGSGVGFNTTQLGPDFPGKYYREDLEHLVLLTVQRDVLENDWLDYTIRVLWLRARFLMVQGQPDFALGCFDMITNYLQSELDSTGLALPIKLANCKMDNLVTLEEVQKQLESVQRCQSLEEIHRLYETEEYQTVVDLLTPTFFQFHARGKIDHLKNIPERHAQLQLLQDSLWKLENYQQYLHWGEMAFNEALDQYLSESGKSRKANWSETIAKLLVGLEKCLRKDHEILNTLQANSLIRFAQNLIKVITVQLDTPESINSAKTTIVYPWMLLYRLINHEEIKIRMLLSKQISKEDGAVEAQDFDTGVPSSLMLLYNAHEFLGRRCWCCNCNGELLLLYSDVLAKELKRFVRDSPHPFREDLESSLEQCFYCLYGHPNKRKARHLQDHSSSQVPLTWERAVTVYEFFKPKQVPEFDSHKTSTVSAELENLLRRIIALVPPQQDPANKIDIVTGFIEGTSEQLPLDIVDKSIPIVTGLYYLLADYYFKNKEFGKAIRFYTLDICVNPERLDSWAGMALARSSQLEQKLNSVGAIDGQLGDDDDDDDKKGQTKCELKNERAIYSKSASALRCFQKALEINKNHTTLWIEYGSLSYMLHSHASRQLKQKEQFCLTSEMIDTLKLKRTEMLHISEVCFQSANKAASLADDEEEWLHHYMLGKIAEKLGKPITIALGHYEQASFHLHEMEARYPRRIQYHNPPDYAMEALEVYYRMHAAALKYLMNNEKRCVPAHISEAIFKYLKSASESPFATFQEKRCSSLNSSDVDEPIALPPGEQSKRPCTSSITYDHDYFRRKRKDSSTEDSELEARLRNSTDSSSESMDSATVKDLLNSILAVVTERCPEKNVNPDVLVVLGDMKIQKPASIKVSNKQPIVKSDSVASFSSVIEKTQPDILNSTTEVNASSSTLMVQNNVAKNGSSQIANDETGIQSASKICNDKKNNCGAKIDMSAATSRTALGDEKKGIEQNETKSSDTLVDNTQDVQVKMKKSGGNGTNNVSDQDIESAKMEDVVDNSKGRGPAVATNIATSSTEATNQSCLIEMCLAAIKQCLLRFSQHYKSLYRLAHYYCYSSQQKNLHWSRDYLLGRNIAWQQMAHMPCPGLFSERKNTNLFNGIWRIPNDDIDRPGSFGSHMYRSIVLLIEVLRHLKDYIFLINLTLQLHRNPETGKKFLRDMDRLYLYGLAQDKTMLSLKKEMKKLCNLERTAEVNEKIIRHLLAIYRAWNNYVKCASNPDMVNKMLEDAYRLYKPNECEKSTAVLDQATKFCQFQMSIMKFPKVFPMAPFELSKTSYPHSLPFPLGERRSVGATMDHDSTVDPQSWRAEALENAAKLLLSSPESKSDMLKLKDKSSELSIKTVSNSIQPLLREPVVKSSVNSNTREIINKAINESKPVENPNQGTSGNNKVSWSSNTIPASGMVIGSMTITPIGVGSPPLIAEGLLGRLAVSRPKSPLDLSSTDTKKTANVSTTAVSATSTTISTVPTTCASTLKTNSFPPFDPSRLTADVQSKISSLDPVEHASRASVSGFQMEFMRQIAQRQRPSLPRALPRPIGSPRPPPPYQPRSSSHQWGNRVAMPGSISSPQISSSALVASPIKTPAINPSPHLQNTPTKTNLKQSIPNSSEISVKITSGAQSQSVSVIASPAVPPNVENKETLQSSLEKPENLSFVSKAEKTSDIAEQTQSNSPLVVKPCFVQLHSMKSSEPAEDPLKSTLLPLEKSGLSVSQSAVETSAKEKNIEVITLSSNSNTDLSSPGN